jgi:selenocysteine lyase/cysteine desulfurase
VRAERLDQLTPAWPSFGTVSSPDRPLDLELRAEAQRLDLGLLPHEHSAWAGASLDVMEAAGLEDAQAAAADGAQRLAGLLTERGRTVAPRGRSTLVSWEEDDPEAVAKSLGEAGVVVRHLPGWPYVRASVGAWTSDDDLDRLLDALP